MPASADGAAAATLRVPAGRGGVMADVTIEPRPNGPYLVRGPIRIFDVDGEPFELPGEVVALCRCGGSATKPFCDGTHAKIGFASEPRVSAT
jgi:CDGSH-type Zn-finger protein